MSVYAKTYATKNHLTMEDAKHHLVVTVKKTDIANGKQKDPQCCAIARAILAEKPEAKRVFIFRSTAFIETARRMVRYALPPSVQKEVVAFDRFGLMEPGVYRLSAPQPSRDPKKTAAYKKRLKKTGPARGAPKGKRTANIRVGVRE